MPQSLASARVIRSNTEGAVRVMTIGLLLKKKPTQTKHCAHKLLCWFECLLLLSFFVDLPLLALFLIS